MRGYTLAIWGSSKHIERTNVATAEDLESCLQELFVHSCLGIVKQVCVNKQSSMHRKQAKEASKEASKQGRKQPKKLKQGSQA